MIRIVRKKMVGKLGAFFWTGLKVLPGTGFRVQRAIDVRCFFFCGECCVTSRINGYGKSIRQIIGVCRTSFFGTATDLEIGFVRGLTEGFDETIITVADRVSVTVLDRPCFFFGTEQ